MLLFMQKIQKGDFVLDCFANGEITVDAATEIGGLISELH